MQQPGVRAERAPRVTTADPGTDEIGTDDATVLGADWTLLADDSKDLKAIDPATAPI